MQGIAVHATTTGTPDAVWSLITDLEGSPSVVSGIDAIEVLTPGPFAVGTTWRETRTMFGRQATEEMTVTGLDPGRSYTVEASSHGMHYVSTLTLTSEGSRTRIAMSFDGRPLSLGAKVLGAITGWMATKATTKALQQDVDDLARAATRPPATE
jgi:carbon monoxide dehydrogenase subunit G